MLLPDSTPDQTLRPAQPVPVPRPPADVLPSGTVVAAKYRVSGIIGRGGHGLVYSAEHVATGQAVAVKMLWCDDGEPDPRARERFLREARLTAALAHPNTVRVLDYGEHEGVPYLAMEQLAGVTLEAQLRVHEAAGRSMPAAEAVAISVEVLRSLQEAHGRGLVHRDIKPSNVMLVPGGDGDLHVKVLDFGIAHDLGGDRAPTGLRGTPAYMSPEQCEGLPVDGRSDLYALGVVLFRCVCGRLPFDEVDGAAMLRAHVSRPPLDARSLGDVPAGLAECIHRALRKAPAERFADAAAMRQALDAALQPPLQPVPMPARSPARARSQIAPWTVAVLACSALGTLALTRAGASQDLTMPAAATAIAVAPSAPPAAAPAEAVLALPARVGSTAGIPTGTAVPLAVPADPAGKILVETATPSAARPAPTHKPVAVTARPAGRAPRTRTGRAGPTTSPAAAAPAAPGAAPALAATAPAAAGAEDRTCLD